MILFFYAWQGYLAKEIGYVYVDTVPCTAR